MLRQIPPSNIGFESFVVAATPLPIKAAALLTHQKVKVRDLLDATMISPKRTCPTIILDRTLHMKKLSYRWVPRMLTPDQKYNREKLYKINELRL